MMWANGSQFFAMGGYGLYVWGSIGMCVLAVVVELGALVLRRRALRQPSAELDGQSTP
ncbi:MAG: heme exporter protein CcmD [Rhodoferax sp.]|nr:heme exporter protein CcmD [Rhodoferax sp.]